MEDAPLLSNSQELVRRPDHVPALRPDEDVPRRYDVLIHFAAVLSVEAVDYVDARRRATGSTVLAVFDHDLGPVSEIVVAIREADA
jgi:hypothetical protein